MNNQSLWRLPGLIFGVLICIALVSPKAGCEEAHGIFPTQEKGLCSDECVTVKGMTYTVSKPWKGFRFGFRDDPQSMGLVRVPADFSYKQSKIYVKLETRDAFVRMAESARMDGVHLQVDSGYRSMSYQRKIYQRLMEKGQTFQEIADRGTAPPGYSEHMLGIAFDLVPSNSAFVETAARKWLLENAEKFCFVESYPEDRKNGFLWEPWHWRYNGCDTGLEKTGKMMIMENDQKSVQ